ncbi:MAG: McrC family protein [Chloroflexota bacterium]|nr:McrC family protein [Chloroflexota bacterium]
MTEAIRLTEYRDTGVWLDRADAGFIASRLGGRITIRREVTSEEYFLNPAQFVGVVTLPSGRRLECQSKVPVGNLFHMLAIASGIESPFRDEAIRVDRLDELLEFVVDHFTGLVERRIDRGLYRAYVEREDNLSSVRGRIGIAEDVRRNHILRHRTWCRFDEFTWDIPENQVVRQVVHLLGGWVRRPDLRLRLRRIDGTLAEVSPTTMPASAIDRFTYHRLNDDYRPIHRLCRLFLAGSSLSEHEGPIDFRAFLIDMNRLFEAFVTEVLRARAPVRTRLRSQSQLFLGHEKKVEMRPDLAVDRDGTTVLVADCKYKRLDASEFRHHDVYQLFAYCVAADVDRGLLIYPAHTDPIHHEVRIRHVPIAIRHTSIDLGGSLESLGRACDGLATDVFDWTD